ncbi:hypothetical protein GTO36_08905 [bacterium]|nr:hypothetical protein [bacterium]
MKRFVRATRLVNHEKITAKDQDGTQGFMFVRVKTYAIIPSPKTEASVLLLKDEESDVALPVWIDSFKGKIILDLSHGVLKKRPGTYDLMKKILSECGAKVTRVAITDRKQGIYSAIINIETKGRQIELDCSPSDAIALAICERAPVFVSDKLLSVGYVIKMKAEDVDPFEKWLKKLNPDFFKYKM